ncbi:hypothetical protein Hamer_G007635, partial [Homarus americanus]
MESKALLCIDNCPGYAETIKYANPNIKCLDQRILALFKSYYLSCSFFKIYKALEEDG